MKTSLVLGLGFGDEGKGRTVSYLVSQSQNPLVVRFNGGHQAGHTVVNNGNRHVFSSFGSGTLQGAPTFWTKYCTIYPTAVINEYDTLPRSVNPSLYVDPLCPVTTPFDIDVNRTEEENRENPHGSVGVGFGATIARHENYYRLYFQDLFFDGVLNAKLDMIQNYYSAFRKDDWDTKRNLFIKNIKRVREIAILKLPEQLNFNEFDHIIFEGAQGILLDMDFGFFPNVTRSNTTSKNALSLIIDWNISDPEIYYVTRCYQTRHGAGFMSNQEHRVELINNENETNSSQSYQGEFRISTLDIELLKYALKCDENFSKGLEKNLIITCEDQIQKDGLFFVTSNEGRLRLSPSMLLRMLDTVNFKKLLVSNGPETLQIEKIDL